MKKSRKLVIGLTFLTAAATAALATTVVGILKNQNLPPENKLELSKKKFGEKVNETKELIDKLQDPKYKDIRKKLQDALDEANKNITKDSKAEDYDKQTDNLSWAIEEVKKDKEQIDNNDSSLDKAKKDYEKAKKSAEDLASKLTDDKYKTVKDKLEKAIADATKNINDNSSKEDYKLATEKLNKAIEVANNEKTAIDNQNETLADAINNFNNKLQEAKALVEELKSKPEYNDIKNALEQKISEAANLVITNQTKESFQTATSNLSEAIETARQDRESKDRELVELENAKNAYKAKKTKAEKLIEELSVDPIYKDIKDNLTEQLNNIDSGLNENSTKVDYENAITNLENAIQTAKEAKRELNKEMQNLDQPKAAYKSQLKKAEDLSNGLNRPKYEDIKAELDQKIAEIKNGITDTSTKKDYQDATGKLEDLVEAIKQKAEERKNNLEQLELAKTLYEQKLNEALQYKNEISANLKYGSIYNRLENQINYIQTTIYLENIFALQEATRDLYNFLIYAQSEAAIRDNLWQELLDEKAKLQTLKQNVEGKDHLNDLKAKINTKFNELFPNDELTNHGLANNQVLEQTVNDLVASVLAFQEEFDLLEAKQNYLQQLKLVNEKLSEIDNSINKEHYKEIKNKLVSKKELAEAMASGNTKTSYDSAAQELSNALAQAIAEIQAKDQELNSPEGMKKLLEDKLKEAKDYANNDLNSDKDIYSYEKDQLEQKTQAVEEEVNNASEDQKTKEFYQDKIDKLNKALDQAKKDKEEKDLRLSEFDELVERANKLDKNIDDTKYYSYIKDQVKWLIKDNFGPKAKGTLSALTHDARKQKIDYLRNRVIYIESVAETLLISISKYLDLKKDAEALIQELSKNEIYNDIKIELERKIFDCEEKIEKSNYIGFSEQNPALEEALELSKKGKKEKDLEQAELAKAKSTYETAKKSAEDLVAKLGENGAYNEIKQKLSQEIEGASQGIISSSTKNDYQAATLKIQNAIKEAKEAKRAKEKENQSLEDAKAKYEAQVNAAETLSNELGSKDYSELKNDFDSKVDAIKETVLDSSSKEDYQSATEKLEDLIEETKEKFDLAKLAKTKWEALRNKKLEVKAYRSEIMGVFRNAYFRDYLLQRIEEIKNSLDKTNPESIDQGIKLLDELLVETPSQVQFRESLWNKLLEVKEKYEVLEKWSKNDSELTDIHTKIQSEIERVFNDEELVKHSSLNNTDLQKRISEIVNKAAQLSEEIELIKLTNRYNTLKIKVDELLVELGTKDIYKNLKEKFENKKADAENELNTLHDIRSALSILFGAYEEVLNQKRFLDQQSSESEEKDHFKNLYEKKLNEANNFADTDIIETNYSEIREELKSKIAQIENEVSEASAESKTEDFWNQKISALEEAVQNARNRRYDIDNLGLEINEARNRYEVAKQNAQNYIQEQLNQPKYLQIKNELQSKIDEIENDVISSPGTKELFDQKEAELNQWLRHAQNEKAGKDSQESGNSSTARQGLSK